jgi:hypothetical protein
MSEELNQTEQEAPRRGRPPKQVEEVSEIDLLKARLEQQEDTIKNMQAMFAPKRKLDRVKEREGTGLFYIDKESEDFEPKLVLSVDNIRDLRVIETGERRVYTDLRVIDKKGKEETIRKIDYVKLFEEGVRWRYKVISEKKEVKTRYQGHSQTPIVWIEQEPQDMIDLKQTGKAFQAKEIVLDEEYIINTMTIQFIEGDFIGQEMTFDVDKWGGCNT